MDNKERGAYGEKLALAYLTARGYKLIAQNKRIGRIEVDLILECGGVIVFAEVKARAGYAYGLPREAVDRRKQRRLLLAAQAYMAKLPADTPARMDVVEVNLSNGAVTHIENAFS